MFVNLSRIHCISVCGVEVIHQSPLSPMLRTVVKVSLLLTALALFVKGSSFQWDLLGKSEAHEALSFALQCWGRAKWLLIPLMIGSSLSVLAWQTVFLDSNVPGVDPPQPFAISPGPKFHSGYIFAVVIGPVITAILLFHEFFS